MEEKKNSSDGKAKFCYRGKSQKVSFTLPLKSTHSLLAAMAELFRDVKKR